MSQFMTDKLESAAHDFSQPRIPVFGLQRSLLRHPRTRRCGRYTGVGVPGNPRISDAGKGLAAVLAPCYSGRLACCVNRVPRLGTATNRELTDGPSTWNSIPAVFGHRSI